MHQTAIVACLILRNLFFPGVQAPSQKEEIPSYEDKDAYEVYAAALKLGRPHQDSIERARLLIIQQDIESWRGCQDTGIELSKKSKKEWQPVLNDLIRANQTPRKLTRTFSLKVPYRLLSKEELNAGFPEGGGWKAYYEKFPDSNGYIWFSAVGFNADKSKAIVYVNHACGGLCGGGGPHFLEKKDGRWVEARVDAIVQVWAS